MASSMLLDHGIDQLMQIVSIEENVGVAYVCNVSFFLMPCLRNRLGIQTNDIIKILNCNYIRSINSYKLDQNIFKCAYCYNVINTILLFNISNFSIHRFHIIIVLPAPAEALLSNIICSM
jgi:hypothetical protein